MRFRFKKRLKYNKKQSFAIIFTCLLVIGVTLGFALLTTKLKVSGTSQVSASTWDVHFENVQAESGSVTATSDPVISNDTEINFSAELAEAGEFYGFTVDVVNDGTYDAKLDELVISPELTSAQQEYFSYTVTYSDGVEIKKDDALNAGSTETLLVHFEYKENADTSKYPSEDEDIDCSVSMYYVQGEGNEVAHPKSLYDVLKEAATDGTYATTYTGSHQDSMAGVGDKAIYHWKADDDTEATAILDKWNVIFGGFCWQMIRTTDTGGVKVLYSGVPSDGKCIAEGEGQQIGTSKFNTSYNSPAYVGYMYNPSTLITYKANSAATSGSLFGTDVTYSGGNYTLTNTSTTYDTTHHYTCNNTTGTCSTVRYYYYNNYFTEISDGRSIEEALEDMLSSDNVNNTDSTIKAYIDNWYQNNITSNTSKLEDTIFCNDRSIKALNGWNPNGGSKTGNLQFKNYNSNSDLSCINETDKFSLANSKAQLTYPVGLMTLSEMYLLNNDNLRKTGHVYWLASPDSFFSSNAIERYLYSSGSNGSSVVNVTYGVRPAVSLTTGTKYTSGDGSKTNPYIIE